MRPVRMRPSTRLSGAAAAGALLLAGCAGPPGGAAATVNDASIPESAFAETVRVQTASERSPIAGLEGAERASRLDELQRQVLTQLIRVELLEQIAVERDLEVTEEEVQERWEEQVALQGGDEQALRDLIASVGLTEEEARDQLRLDVLQQKLRADLADEVEVTDAEVRAVFEERAGEFERADVSHILVADEAEAEAIIDLLEQGGSFEELATSRSLDQGSAANGGRLGSQPRGTYVAPFEEAVWSAEEGAIVGPVETQFGFHVIRVDAFETRTFEDVEESLRDEIAGGKVSEAFDRVVAELFADADVTVDSRFGRWDPATGQVVAASPLAPRADPVAPGTAPTPTEPAGS